MTNDYSTEAQEVADAMNAVYENKQTNKKNDISGDYSSDNASYPTVKAAKSHFGEKVTNFSNTPSDSNYPSEKLVSDSLDNKIDKSSTSGLVKNDGTIDTNTYLTEHQSLTNYIQKSNTAGLVKNDGTIDTNNYLTEHQSLDGKTVTVEKQQTADSGYASTYVIKQGGSQVGVKINIDKDRMLRSASYETVGSTPTTEETNAGMSAGDKYIKLVVNTADSDSASNLILPITDIFDFQTADNTTLVLSNGVYAVKTGGIDTAQLKDAAVTSDKIATAVKNSWLTDSDVQSEISAFASALANAINPPSSP